TADLLHAMQALSQLSYSPEVTAIYCILPPDLPHFRRSGDYKAITPICKPLFDFSTDLLDLRRAAGRTRLC
ncbi:hypothetical protein, partial [Cupriavidus pauculus]|uniref:hypothetical protein n=1 Tax=Cupriavidus pauculus TaxID=82633 RepID=UPI0030F5C243